ncbi:MAG: hypothetical protein Q8P18_29220 [Pseudomonadota bacterium]|nr:hypothetical protein [Pseudomonadota bacterium]
MHRSSLTLTLSLLLSPLLFIGSGCRPKDEGEDTSSADTDTDTDADTDTDTDTDTDVATASITLTSPVDGPAYGAVTLTYTVAGFVIDTDALASGDLVPVEGEGHVHIKLDGEYVNATSDMTYTLEGLTAGAHTVSVVLAGNDHAESAISDSVTLNVLNPTVEILSPTDAAALNANSASLGLSISDFTMSSDVGGAPVIGEGHYHVLIDGAYFDYGTDPTRALATQLDAGSHSLAVELVNSDHTSLSPAVMDTITVDVAGDAPSIWIDKAPLATEQNTASVVVPVTVTNFTLAPDAVGGTNQSGYGHYHVYLDGTYSDYSASESAMLYHVAAGPHTVEVRLAENDHTEIPSGSIDYSRFSVATGRPDVFITSPAPGEFVTSDFTVSVNAESFVLDPANIGNANVAGTGHYHVYVDGLYNTFSGDASVLVTGLELGTHVVTATLVNNDHTNLTQQVWSPGVTVTVQ